MLRHEFPFLFANCCHTRKPLEFIITHNMLQKKPQEHTYAESQHELHDRVGNNGTDITMGQGVDQECG